MKKKILLFLMLTVLLSCVFAIAISASSFESSFTNQVTKFYNGSEELVPEWLDLDDTSATAVIKKANGEIIRIPLYYIYQEKGTQFMGDVRDTKDQGSTGFRYAWLSDMLGEEINHSNLVALEIPNGTVSIKSQFGGTSTIYSALEELVIPTTVTSLGQKFIRDNPIIKKLFVKQAIGSDGKIQGVTTIPDYFADITVSGNTSSLEFFAFELDYVTSIGSNAFMRSSVQSLTFEGPITTVKGTAFSSCLKLESVSINNTGDVITIGGKAFAYSASLKSVILNGFSLSDYLFENVNGVAGSLTVIATNVKTTGTMPFKNATNLSKVEISGPITSIGNQTFSGCASLKSAKITNTLDAPATCGNNTFDGLKGLESVTLHGISLGPYMFRNTNGPVDMTVVATNVGTIGNDVFYNAENTVEIYVSGALTSVNTGNTFRDCGKLKKLTLINTGDTYVFAGNGEVNAELTDLIIMGKINVGSPAFQNNHKLKNIYLGDGVYEIGAQAFYKCFGLETVYLADSVTVIGDKAFDMESSGNQTSQSFTFVDENGNVDNYLPLSLTTISGHFLKHIKIANNELIFPEGFTRHSSTAAYDFEGTRYPEGFRLIYLGKMEIVDLRCFYMHNNPHNVTVYLANNSASDLKNERVTADVTTNENGTTIAHGTYAGVNANGTLEILVDNRIQNNIKVNDYIKFYFCGTNEVCFVTRVNIPWGPDNVKDWGNFVSTPVTYEELILAGASIDKHPIVSAPEYSDATCTEDGGVKTYCLACGEIASIEKTADALGHDYDITNPNSIVYSDITSNGTYIAECARCFEDIEEVVENTYLFICLGYSASKTGDGISLGFKVNGKAIEKYTSVMNISMKFGVFAVSQGKLGENNIFDENGNTADGVISAEIKRTDFSGFDIKVVGFESEEQKSAMLALGAYVMLSNGEISYIQAEIANEKESYHFISYNGIVNQ